MGKQPTITSATVQQQEDISNSFHHYVKEKIIQIDLYKKMNIHTYLRHNSRFRSLYFGIWEWHNT